MANDIAQEYMSLNDMYIVKGVEHPLVRVKLDHFIY
jgi:hypothetical protein